MPGRLSNLATLSAMAFPFCVPFGIACRTIFLQAINASEFLCFIHWCHQLICCSRPAPPLTGRRTSSYRCPGPWVHSK
uniref:Uncharacterized protein n=1 Tax=Arundo donax TaxID=35708 RepID=A0A0A9BRJ1_ARUDO